jgi:Fe-S-cluster containining protein|tara:strand:+ start:4144 stop:4857 length:714 start_codon:yes stop_codon:yes gene_type:complete
MFECFHCGECCVNPATQIGVTVGDLVRMSSESGMSVVELFEKHVGIVPFQSGEEGVYEMDLGLRIPCHFRKGIRCEGYKGRPLNCRLFPLWILVEHKDSADEILTELNKCRGQRLEGEAFDKTKKYVDMIKSVLMNESKLSDEIVKELELGKKVDITTLEGYDDFAIKLTSMEEQYKDKGVGLMRKMLEKEKVLFVMRQCPTPKDVGEKIWKEMVKKGMDRIVMPIKEIDIAERVLI